MLTTIFAISDHSGKVCTLRWPVSTQIFISSRFGITEAYTNIQPNPFRQLRDVSVEVLIPILGCS